MRGAPATAQASKPERLTSSRDIRRVLQGRRRRAGRTVVVHVSDTRGSGPPRVAVVASRKVGGAVERNRAKRLLREAARSTAWRSGVDVVLVARRACAAAGLGEVEGDVSNVAQRLDAIVGAADREVGE